MPVNPSIVLLFLTTFQDEYLTFLVLLESDLGFLNFLGAGGGWHSSVGSEAVSMEVEGSAMGEVVVDSMEASPLLGDESTSSSGSGFSTLLGSSLEEDLTAKNWCIPAAAGVPKLACIKANQSGMGTPGKAVIMPVRVLVLISAVLSSRRNGCLRRSRL